MRSTLSGGQGQRRCLPFAPSGRCVSWALNCPEWGSGSQRSTSMQSCSHIPAGAGRGPRVPPYSHPGKWGLRCVTQVLSAVSLSVPLGPSAGAAMGDTGAHPPCWGSHSRCLSDLVHAGAWRGRSRGACWVVELPVCPLSGSSVSPVQRKRVGHLPGQSLSSIVLGTAVGGRWS